MQKTLEQHLHLSPGELETFFSLSLTEFLNLPAVNQLLSSLDTALLKQTLPTAKVVLAEQLPSFYEWLQNELGVKRVPDSPDHTTKWVVNFLNNRESLTRLVELHRPVPRLALERSIPSLVAMFEEVEDIHIRQEWQKAIAALCLVLVVAACSDERSVGATV
jgi:hypothetical protein